MKNSKLIIYSLVIGVTGMLTFTGCKDEEVPDIVNEEELITTVSLAFENTLTGDVSTFIFKDIDGPGGALPGQFDTIRLAADSEYNLTTSLLNESVSPAEDITAEVEAEGVDHQFFYTISAGLNITITYNDIDANGNPIGIINSSSTTGVSSGFVTVILKHQPDIKDGNITTGDTDVEVMFVAEIE